MNTKNSLILTKRYKDILSAVHMVYRLVNSTYDKQELCLRLTRLLGQFIVFDTCCVYILDQKKSVSFIASFNNKINILKKKRKELGNIPDEEKRVMKGYSIFREDLIGLPLVADDNIGAIFVRKAEGQDPFESFDKDILAVIAEQSVTAIKNLTLSDNQHNIILGSMEVIAKLVKKTNCDVSRTPASVCCKIAKSLGESLHMPKEGIENLYYASILRDAGAMNVPYEILSKAGKLTSEELEIIKKQPAKSAEIIKSITFLKPVLPILLYYREKYDGTGYPFGLKKEQIPLGASIMAVIEAFDAMTKDRPYKQRLSIEEALMDLKTNKGTQFSPKVVDAFLSLSRRKSFRKLLEHKV